MTWIITGSGRVIDFLEPAPNNIWLTDIVSALTNNHRFGGHSPVKVAQHLLEVVAIMLDKATKRGIIDPVRRAEIVLVGLLHDFPEYVVGDIPTPLKRLLGPEFAAIEKRILDAMLLKWDLAGIYAKWETLMHEADGIVVQQEAIRFGLDGRYVAETGEVRIIQNRWVPKEVEITLNKVIWNRDDLEAIITMLFTYNMAVLGKLHLVCNPYRTFAIDLAIEFGTLTSDTPSDKHSAAIVNAFDNFITEKEFEDLPEILIGQKGFLR